MTHEPQNQTGLRLRLLANGYTPVPNVGKTTYLKGWPTIEVTPAVIEEWRRKHSRWPDTGLRIENGLGVLDFDINHEDADIVADRLEQDMPLLTKALLRFGKGHKRAWFFRTPEPFGRLHTRRWLAPGADLDKDGTHVVEAFGGASARQFGAFGAHTREPDGSVTIAYTWADETSPLTVRLDDLPEIDKGTLFRLLDLIEIWLAEAGWMPVIRTQRGENFRAHVYDLTDQMVFECNDGCVRSLSELEAVAGEPGLRCSASWLEPGASNCDRCLIGRTSSGEVCIYETASAITHLPLASKRPSMAQLKERVRQVVSPWSAVLPR